MFDTNNWLADFDFTTPQIPINRPVCPVLNHHRDGSSQHQIHKGQINYWPNRDGVGHPVPVKDGGYIELISNSLYYYDSY